VKVALDLLRPSEISAAATFTRFRQTWGPSSAVQTGVYSNAERVLRALPQPPCSADRSELSRQEVLGASAQYRRQVQTGLYSAVKRVLGVAAAQVVEVGAAAVVVDVKAARRARGGAAQHVRPGRGGACSSS
jgi:hypothetical protein